MEVDINNSWTSWTTYSHPGSRGSGALMLVKVEHDTSCRWLRLASRDFFADLAR